MKVLAVLTYYYPHWTGLTAHAQSVAEGLASRGHEVTVLTSRHDMRLARDEMVNGVRVIRLQPMLRISRGMVTPAFPLAAAQLIAQSDVVHIHTPLMESLLLALLSRAIGRPLLMTHHGDLTMPAGLANRVVESTVTAMMRGAGLLASRVSAYSRDYADNSPFLRTFAGKLAYILPPVAIPSPQPEVVQAWRRELGLDGKRLVGFAGRFVEEKGFDFLLEALPLIRERIPEAHFVYAGEHQVVYENFYQQCKPMIDANAEHLTFLGLIRDRQKLANFYALCDLFTLPSRTDCLAIVQVESLLCGTPLVTADIPGARIVVRDTGGGVLVSPRNPRALADGICRVLADPAPFARTPDEVRAVFSGERSLDQYEDLLLSLVKERRHKRGGPRGRPENV